MKRLTSRSTWWHMVPRKSESAVNAAERGGQPVDHIDGMKARASRAGEYLACRTEHGEGGAAR